MVLTWPIYVLAVVLLTAGIVAYRSRAALKRFRKHGRGTGEAGSDGGFQLRDTLEALRASVDRLSDRLFEESSRRDAALARIHARIDELARDLTAARARPLNPQEVSTPRVSKLEAQGGPNAKAVDIAAMDDLEVAGRELLVLCDSQPLDVPAIRARLHPRGLRCTVLHGDERDWYLLQIEKGDLGLLIPAMRRPMGSVPLSPDFDFTDYNGFDPIRPAQVLGFAQRERAPEGWRALRKGHINGTR